MGPIMTAQDVFAPAWPCALSDERDDLDEYEQVHADTAAEAAEIFARLHWERDDMPDQGESLDVAVMAGGQDPTRYRVTAEWVLETRAVALDGWPS